MHIKSYRIVLATPADGRSRLADLNFPPLTGPEANSLPGCPCIDHRETLDEQQGAGALRGPLAGRCLARPHLRAVASSEGRPSRPRSPPSAPRFTQFTLQDVVRRCFTSSSRYQGSHCFAGNGPQQQPTRRDGRCVCSLSGAEKRARNKCDIVSHRSRRQSCGTH